MARTAIVPLFLALIATSGAWGQEAIPTAAGAAAGGAPASPVTGAAPLPIPGPPAYDGPGVVVGPCGVVSGSTRPGGPAPDKSIHGQVWGGVGTSGYREVGGTACAPIGQSGSMSIAIDRTEGPNGAWAAPRR